MNIENNEGKDSYYIITQPKTTFKWPNTFLKNMSCFMHCAQHLSITVIFEMCFMLLKYVIHLKVLEDPAAVITIRITH